MRPAIAVVLLAAIAPAGVAEAADCSSAATQSDMNACAAKSFREADAALNVAYKQIVDRLRDDATKKHLLVTAQRAWLGFRDAECAFEASGTRGGTLYPTIVTQCHEALTRGRTTALRNDAKCEEGDLSCPVPPN